MPNGKFMNRKSLRPAIQDGASVILRSTEKGAALCEQQSVLAGQSLAGTDAATLGCVPRLISRMNLIWD